MARQIEVRTAGRVYAIECPPRPGKPMGCLLLSNPERVLDRLEKHPDYQSFTTSPDITGTYLVEMLANSPEADQIAFIAQIVNQAHWS